MKEEILGFGEIEKSNRARYHDVCMSRFVKPALDASGNASAGY
jgi:hypothetical protein